MRAPHVLTPHVDLATRPAPGRASQDRALMLPHAVAVLDGATDPQEPHGRDGAWYADTLAQALVASLTPGRPLAESVTAAICDLVREHALVPGSSPSSTVAIVSWDDEHVTAYALGDSTVVAIMCEGQPRALVDNRLRRVASEQRRQYRDRLAAGHGYDDRHRDQMRRVVELERAARNRPGGYWIAEATPDAGLHGLTATWLRRDLLAVLLATDGAAAALDYGQHADWLDAWQHIDAHGPDAYLAAVEAAELQDRQAQRWPRSKPSDDKTLAVIRLA